MSTSTRAFTVLAAVLALPATAAPSPQIGIAHLPAHFEANAGQENSDVLYASRSPAGALLLMSQAAIVQPANGAQARVELVASNPAPKTRTEARLPGHSNYLRGRDAKKWIRDVQHFERVRYDAVWPGVDVVFYGNDARVEWDFVVAAGADPDLIRLRSADARLDDAGDVVLGGDALSAGLKKPVAYQVAGGIRRPVDARYEIRSGEIRVALGDYDRAKELVIDPIVDYSTFIGSTKFDEALAIAVDGNGNAYVAGYTRYSDFPTTPSYDPSYNGGDYDAFVAKLSADGQTLLYSTYLGGTSYDQAQSIAVDASGNAYVGGFTNSADFPSTARPYAGNGDAFAVKLSPDGSALLWSNLLGGATGQEGAHTLALDSSGNAYVGGLTWSTDFPTLKGFQMTFGGGAFDTFVAKLSSVNGAPIYVTYLGGSGEDWLGGVAVDASGRAYIAGFTNSANFPTAAALQPALKGNQDVFITRLAATGKTLSYSTYLGGSDADRASDVAVDSKGAAYVAGSTSSSDFPTVNSLQPPKVVGGGLPSTDAFVTKIAADGSAIRYSTYLGGSNSDGASGIALDASANAYVTGTTFSHDFPQVKPFQAPEAGNLTIDGFVTRISATGKAILFSSTLGGPGNEYADAIAVDPLNRVYIVGTAVGGFPTVNALQPTVKGGKGDAFIARIAQDADAVPDLIEFNADQYYAKEVDGFAFIGIKRTGNGYGRVVAQIILGSGGTATPGYDYVNGPLTLSWWHNGTGIRKGQLPIIADSLAEPTETVPLSLQIYSGFAVVGPRSTAVLNIKNTDNPPQPVAVAVGFGAQIQDAVDNWAYPGSIVVTNSQGNPMPGVTIALTGLGEAFQKGVSKFQFWDDGRPSHWAAEYQASAAGNGFGCLEDVNGNGVLDSGEDINGNGTLEPGNVATVPASVVTDANGQASFSISYPKTHAEWARIALRTQAVGAYTSTPITRLQYLPTAASVTTDPDNPPPNQFSPYGQNGDCASPN